MGACFSKEQIQGNFSSLRPAVGSIQQVADCVSLSNRSLIEKPDRLNPKFSLSSFKLSSYGPTITRLAVKLWQTKDGLQ
jgi:hypothetical protein